MEIWKGVGAICMANRNLFTLNLVNKFTPNKINQ